MARSDWGGSALGGKGSVLPGGDASNVPLPPSGSTTRYKMRALNSLGALVSWTVNDAPDTDASEWVGGNTPLTEVSVAASWVVTV